MYPLSTRYPELQVNPSSRDETTKLVENIFYNSSQLDGERLLWPISTIRCRYVTFYFFNPNFLGQSLHNLCTVLLIHCVRLFCLSLAICHLIAAL